MYYYTHQHEDNVRKLCLLLCSGGIQACRPIATQQDDEEGKQDHS